MRGRCKGVEVNNEFRSIPSGTMRARAVSPGTGSLRAPVGGGGGVHEVPRSGDTGVAYVAETAALAIW